MRRMIPQKLIDVVKALAEKSTELLAIEDVMSVGEDGVSIGDNVSITGTITANKVVEAGDTELIDLSSYINSNFAKSHTLYAKLIAKHGFLLLVVSGNFVAGESAGANPQILNNFYQAVSSLGDKIFRAEGTAISADISSSSPASNTFIAAANAVKSVGTLSATSLAILQSTAKERITLTGYVFGTIAEDTSCWVDIRIPLTI